MSKPRYAYRLGHRSLRRVCPTLTTGQAKSLARLLGQAMAEYDITTRRRATMFIATVAHESMQFRLSKEMASGEAYEGRKDLGNSRRGDGKKYKGRGYIQITGRTNYTALKKAFDTDFLLLPSLLEEPKWAARSAAWWWKTNGCNQLADSGDFRAVTRRVNGGYNGWPDRERLLKRARPVGVFLIPRRRKP